MRVWANERNCWLLRDGIAAMMNVSEAYTVKHIQKGLTLLDRFELRNARTRNTRKLDDGYEESDCGLQGAGWQ